MGDDKYSHKAKRKINAIQCVHIEFIMNELTKIEAIEKYYGDKKIS